MEVAERHRVRISEIDWPDRPGIRISASFGVADLGCIDGDPTPEKLIAAADRALYRAKETGRDRVIGADRVEWPRIAG
jgi:PleD family two-component response regulator